MSRTVHTGRRGVSTSVTIALAALTALITLWLGCLAQFSGARSAESAPTSDRLAVIQVRAGETLHHVAARVAPDSSAAVVIDRIKDLNRLESGELDAGQTLIAPVS